MSCISTLHSPRARTHETKRFPGYGGAYLKANSLPPTSDAYMYMYMYIYIYTYIYMSTCMTQYIMLHCLILSLLLSMYLIQYTSMYHAIKSYIWWSPPPYRHSSEAHRFEYAHIYKITGCQCESQKHFQEIARLKKCVLCGGIFNGRWWEIIQVTLVRWNLGKID